MFQLYRKPALSYHISRVRWFTCYAYWTIMNAKERHMVTVERLKELLAYDPVSGLFTWRTKLKGLVAGTLTSDGYVSIGLEGKRYYAHRLAWFYMTGVWPTEEIDHRDRARSNNAWSNLRQASKSQNKHNRAGAKNIIPTKSGKWLVYMKLEGQAKTFGTFACFGEAVRMRAQVKKDLHPFYHQ